jgi:KDO2-lipid IV(A) lauroyltransferase
MMKKFIKIFIKYPVEGIFINFVYLFFKILPIDISSSTGSFIAKSIGPILSVNKVIRKNLEKAFPDKDNNWYEKINNQIWSNFGRVTAEYSHFSKLASNKNERISIFDNELSRDFFDTSVKKILVSSHNANWEIMGIACRKNSDKISGIVRQPNNPYAKKIINNLRNRFSVTCYEKNMIGTKNIINDFYNGNVENPLVILYRVRRIY